MKFEILEHGKTGCPAAREQRGEDFYGRRPDDLAEALKDRQMRTF